MALKAYKEETFKAILKFEDEKYDTEVEFRMPRTTDVYTSSDGNDNLGWLKTFANMAKPFPKPIPIELDSGSIEQVDSLHRLIDLGVLVNTADVAKKWLEKRQEIEAKRDKLVGKFKSGGNSKSEDTPEEDA